MTDLGVELAIEKPAVVISLWRNQFTEEMVLAHRHRQRKRPMCEIVDTGATEAATL